MEQTLIIKYKPSVLKDFIGDEKMKNMINLYVDINSINILFVGDSGSQKSTLADIIIKRYYGDQEKNNSGNILYINTLKEQGFTITEMK